MLPSKVRGTFKGIGSQLILESPDALMSQGIRVLGLHKQRNTWQPTPLRSVVPVTYV